MKCGKIRCADNIVKEWAVKSLYCLWFGNKKIYSLDQLRKNFDFDTAEMYYLGGGLSRWLRQCGENDIAASVEKMDPLGNISKQLAEIFSVKLPKGRSNTPSVAFSKENSVCAVQNNTSAYAYPESGSFISENAVLSSFNSSFGASNHISGSFYSETGSFMSNRGSFTLNSFNTFSSSFSLFTGSFETASFQSLLESGSLASSGGSFTSGSFNLHEYEYEYGTSFKASSFNFNSFNPECFSTSIANQKNSTSLSENKNRAYRAKIVQLSPQEKIKLNIMFCPLNRFGYGIDLI